MGTVIKLRGDEVRATLSNTTGCSAAGQTNNAVREAAQGLESLKDTIARLLAHTDKLERANHALPSGPEKQLFSQQLSGVRQILMAASNAISENIQPLLEQITRHFEIQ
jgi:hypothetical protein